MPPYVEKITNKDGTLHDLLINSLIDSIDSVGAYLVIMEYVNFEMRR